MLHDCKILPEHFNNILAGLKSFEIRKDDRDPPYHPGDELMLREWSDGAYTGRWVRAEVPLVLRSEFCRPGYCTMSIYPTVTVGARLTRFQTLKAAVCPEDVALLLNTNKRRFCPCAYDRKQKGCDKACWTCVLDWLNAEI